MSVKSGVFYWVECDRPGCDATSPSQDDEGGMWDSSRQAIKGAQEDEDWTFTLAGECFCDEHCPADEDPPDLSGLDEFTSHEATS